MMKVKEKFFCTNNFHKVYYCFSICLVQVLAYSTILFGNETEAIAFAEKNEYGTKDIKTIAEKIADIPLTGGDKRMVIITQGNLKIF